MAKYEVKHPASFLTDQVKKNVLIYGPPGVGKTTLVAGAKNPLLLAVDPQGPVSLLHRPELRDTPCIEIPDVDTMNQVINDIVSKKNGLDQYDTYIVDTLGSTQSLDLMNLRKDVRNEAGKASMNEWSLTNQHMSDYLWKLLTKAKASVIVVAHQREVWKQIQGKIENDLIRIQPAMTPGTWETCQQLFSGIYYYHIFSKKPEIRRLYTASRTVKAITKDRYNLPDSLDNPTWQTIETAVKESFKIND